MLLLALTCSAQPDGTFAYKANFSDWRLDGGKIPYGIFQVGVPSAAWHCVGDVSRTVVSDMGGCGVT